MAKDKKKPNIYYQGASNIAVRCSCPTCCYTFHPSYKQPVGIVREELIWENYCPVCGTGIDKSDLYQREQAVLKTGKDDLADDILRN